MMTLCPLSDGEVKPNSRAPAHGRSLIIASLATVLLAWTTPGFAQDSTAENARIVDGVNDRLAEIRDMSADFVQILDDGLNQPRREEGHLYLERSEKARWEYDYPETRLFVVDGNVMSDYLPAENLLRRRVVEGEVFDRIPLMSILGRDNLRNEFARIDLLDRESARPEVEGTRVLRLLPRRETAVEDIVIEVDPQSFDIRRLLMRYRDGSTNDLVFSGILTNTGLTDGLWEIVPAPGTDIIDTVN